jgi:hypothetical protein
LPFINDKLLIRPNMNNSGLTLVGVVITVLPIILIIATVIVRGKKLFD